MSMPSSRGGGTKETLGRVRGLRIVGQIQPQAPPKLSSVSPEGGHTL